MEPKQTTPETPLQQLRGYLIANDYDVPQNEADFPTWVQEDGRLNRLHKLLLDDKEGAEVTPDFNVFQQELLGDVKKKPGGNAGGLDSGAGLPTDPLSPPNGSASATAGDTEFLNQNVSDPMLAAAVDPVSAITQAAAAAGQQTFAPDFTGPVPAGTYVKPSDAGTAAEGTQYVDAPAQPAAAAEAPDVADDGFFASLGKSLFNGLDPKRIAGNLADYGGDLLEYLTRPVGLNAAEIPLRETKATDIAGRELVAAAQASDLPLSQQAHKSFLSDPSLASAGNLLGSGVASIVPVAAATALTGPTGGALAGGSIGVSATKEAARAAGIGDREATIMATLLAPIQGALESLGVSDPGVAKLALRETLREAVAAGGGKLTAATITTAAKAVLPEVARRVAGGGLREGATELLQGEAEGIAQLTADATRSPDQPGGYGVTPMQALVTNPAEQALAGALLGGGVGALHGGAQAQPATTTQPDATTYYVTGDSSTTDEGALPAARIIGPGTQANTVLVEAQTYEGQTVRREVSKARLLPTESAETAPAAAPAAAAVLPVEDAATVTTPAPEQPTPETPVAPAPAGESSTTNVAAQPAAPDTPNPVVAEPSPAEAPEAAASAPDAARGPLPAAEPDPQFVKKLTPKQQATNNALDALDRYNAFNKTEQKSDAGKKARKELVRAASKAGLTLKDQPSGKAAFDGARVTRANEYTATTPAANHVPLDGRSEEVHSFMEAVLFSGDENNPSELQGLGIKMRGKELSGRELADAVKDIRAGRNTMRAQMVLDTLENGYNQGYLEKSTGTGLATRKFTVPIEDYLGNANEDVAGTERELSDDEIDTMVAQDSNLADAIATYTDPATGEVDYARLAADGGRGALETFFDVPTDVATKIVALANERASQTTAPAEPAGPGIQRGPAAIEETSAFAAGAPAGSPQPDGAAAGSAGPAAATEAVAPLTDIDAGQSAPAPKPAPTLAEQNIAAKAEFAEGLAAFRAARKKGSGVVQSSILGVPAFSAEEAAALTKMAKAAVKLGAVKTKQVIARLRAQGLTDDDVTDDQLRPFVKKLLQDEGIRQPKAPKQAPQNPTDPTNTKERQGARSIAESGLSDELSKGMADRGTDRYTPKSLAETSAQVDRVIASEGIDKAYYTATHASTQHPKDVMEVLRIKVMAHYDAEVRRLTADPTADPAAIDEAVERAGRVADVYVAGGTEDGRALRARQTLQEYAPSVAVARLGKEVRETADAQRKKLEPAAKRRANRVRKEKLAALDAALAAPGVQAVLGQDLAPAPARATKAGAAPDPVGWGSTNKYFTKESAQKAREALRKLGLSTIVPPELIHFLGFHIEAGARSFADVSARAVRDLGQKVRPLLPEAYEQAKQEFIRRGGDNKGFDGPDAVMGALRTELADNLAERIVSAAGPPQQAGFNPVRDMLDTLTRKVREKLPASDKTPRAARELLALAMENQAEYAEVFEKSKALVDSKINSLKLSDAAKQKMRDELAAYHAEIIGQPYADQQLARAYRQAEDTVLPNYGGSNRGQQLDAAATASDAAVARDRQAIIDHVTAGVNDPQAQQELADHVGREFDERLAERQRALRVRNGVGNVQPDVANDEQEAGPAAPTSRVPVPMSQRVRDLLATRATDERVANRLAPDAVREGLAVEGQRLQQIARDHLTDPADTGRSLAEAFVREAGLSGKQAQVFAAAIEREFETQIAKARDKAVQQAYSRKVRTGEQKAAQDLTDRVRKLYTLSPTDEGRVLGLVADEAGLPELTAADNTKLYKLAQAIADAKGDNAKARAVQDFYIGVKSIRGLTGWEGIKSVMYANMLSGLGTQLKNINSTGLNTASDLFYATGWAGFLAVRQVGRSGDFGALKLIGAPLKGLLNRSGADRAYQMLTTGVRPPGYEGKFDEASDLEVMAAMTPKNRKQAALKAYASMAKYIPRLLSANDLMWSGGAEQMWAYNIALTDAVREGATLPGDKIWESVNERLYGTSVRLADAQAQATQELGVSTGGQYRMRVQELMEASRDQRIAAESKRAAAETTFNGPMEGFIGDVMSKLGRLTEAEAGRGTQPLKGIVPFTRIVANVTNAFLNYTPVGGIRAAKGGIGWNGNAFSREYSPMERSVVFAKSMTGAIVMAAAYQLFDEDELTGNGPSDPAANRAWQQRGHKPYTVGGWNYKDSPWYYPLAAVAALKEAAAFDGADFANDVTYVQRASRMLVATTQASFASLSLTNLQDFLNALSDPSKGKDPAERMGRYMQRTAGAVASSVLLPGSGLLRGVSRMGQQIAGSTKREATDVWGMMGQDVPFVRDELPRVYDQLGNEVPVGSNVPFMPVPDVPDDTGATKRINEFLDKYNLFIPDVNRYQSDMQVLKARVGSLTADEKREMRSMTDQQRKAFLLSRLGGEGPMPAEQWQQFYPKRGRLIKEKLLLHLPELEQLAKTNPRKMQRRLKKYYRDATRDAKRGIDFTDPDARPAQQED